MLLWLWLRLLLGGWQSWSRGVAQRHLWDDDRVLGNSRNLVVLTLGTSICRLHLGVLLRISIELLPSALGRLGNLVTLRLGRGWVAGGRSASLHVQVVSLSELSLVRLILLLKGLSHERLKSMLGVPPVLLKHALQSVVRKV